MTAVRTEIRFLLNDREERLSAVRSSDTLLDHLRLTRRLTGTKEGCAEGDCGACTVLVGRRTGDGLVYEPVNACIRLLASVDLCHVVTVEHVGRDTRCTRSRRRWSTCTARSAASAPRASSCRSTALWMRDPKASEAQIEEALQGNLCRCTGYQPIIAAAKARRRRLARQRPAARRARPRPRRPRRPRRRRPRRHPGGRRPRGDPRLRRRPRRGPRRDCRSRRSSPARPTSASGSPSSCGTSPRRSSSTTSPTSRPSSVGPDARHHRRRRQLRRLPEDPRRRVPASLRLLAPDRRLAGPRDGHRRRQHRQRLADRRHAPGADRARRHRHAPQHRRPAHPAARGLLHLLRQAGPASLGIRGVHLHPPARRRHAERRLQDHQAPRRGHLRRRRRLPRRGRERHGHHRAPRLRRHGRDAEARRHRRGRPRRQALDARNHLARRAGLRRATSPR